jgi:cytochrome c-type biogenesis protein
MLASANATVFAAFAAGLLSFVSPCVLPLVPGYLSVISPVRVGAGEAPVGGRAILQPALIFCLSFTVIFVVLGMFAQQIGSRISIIENVAGVLLVVLGLFFLLTPFVGVLNREWRPQTLLEKAGTGGPVVAGAALAVGWTPCLGPILGTVLTAAAERSGVGGGAFLLLAYSAGLAVPFLVSALAFDRLAGAFRWMRDHYTVITAISGVILITVGVLTMTDSMTAVSGWLRDAADSVGLGPVLKVFER